jgi:hypothetical protein
MHFDTKITLKSNHNHTPKQSRSRKKRVLTFFLQKRKKKNKTSPLLVILDFVVLNDSWIWFDC